MLVGSAHAWDGAVAGQIATVDVTSGNNFAFRVTLKGSPTLCSGGSPWAYLNETDSNYKVYISALLAAKAAGNNVTLYTTNNGIYCKIGYVSIQ